MVRASGVALALAAVAAAAPAAQAPARAPTWGTPVRVGTLPATAAEASELVTVDLNGDGLRDVVVGPLVYERIQSVAPVFLLNRGHGRLVDATKQLFVGAPPAIEWNREMVVADFNGDGRPDIFVADTGSDNATLDPERHGGQNKLILSAPDDKYVDATANLPQQLTFTHSAAAADVNGDGTVDIFEGNLSCCGDRVPPELLVNDGSGHFTIAPDRFRGLPVDQWGTTARDTSTHSSRYRPSCTQSRAGSCWTYRAPT